MTDPVLAVRGLVVERHNRRGPPARLLDGVDLDVFPGEGHALIGRSGSGKTTLARAILRLIEPTSGSIRLGGQEISELSRRQFRKLRPQVQAVFQDPQNALDPRWPVGRSVAEPFRRGWHLRNRVAGSMVADLMARVGLAPELATRYPHELSIGQQQRVAIARALASQPRVLVCDEPVAALDGLVQAQVLTLLRELKDEKALALLFITHDVAAAAQLCATTTVLDHGRVVDTGPTGEILARPRHERAASLIAAARKLDPAPPEVP